MPAIDFHQLYRFLATGGIATAGNLGAVWISRSFVPYTTALLFGIAAGITISFLLTKFFAFRSSDWRRASGEVPRFLLVYGFGLVIYWVSAVQVSSILIRAQAEPAVAEVGGVLFGAGLMVVTSYLGHRFFTYRVVSDRGEAE